MYQSNEKVASETEVSEPFLFEMDPSTGFLDADAVRNKGKELSRSYNEAEPYPHIVIENFLPRPIIDMCLAEFEKSRHDGQTVYNSAQERLKRQFDPEEMSNGPRRLFYAFNSLPFIQVMENITGIRGLIPDPYFFGAGFHEIHTGGHLSVHADFNYHKAMHLERRINVLIYLNDDWSEEYGGQLELWDRDMKECLKSVVPEANRCVIFNTTSTSNHGNPAKVDHPDGRSRKSIALYYYTATWRDDMRGHNTQFRARPQSDDEASRPSAKARAVGLVHGLTPPVLWSAAIRAKRALTRT